MAQHFLASKAFRNLTAYEVARMSEEEAQQFFQQARWGSLEQQACPDCGVFQKHKYRRHRKQWQCKACDREFSVTTNTVFADHKISLGKLLLGIWLFMGSPNAISALELSAHLGVQPKTAYVLLGKLKETVLRSMDRSPMEGAIEVDGGHFGGKPRRSNFRKKSDPKAVADAIKGGQLSGKRKGGRRRISKKNLEKLKNRRIVMPLRIRSEVPGEGAIRTFTWVGKAESAEYITDVVLRQVKIGSVIVSDEGIGFSRIADHYDTEVVPHAQMYCTPEGVNQNQAESFMSRLRRMEWTFHGFHSPIYQADYAAYAGRLEDERRKPMKERVYDLLLESLSIGLSVWWRGYWQGKRRGKEILCDELPDELHFKRQVASA